MSLSSSAWPVLWVNSVAQWTPAAFSLDEPSVNQDQAFRATSVNQAPYYTSSFASVRGIEHKNVSNKMIIFFYSHIKQRCYGRQASNITEYIISA